MQKIFRILLLMLAAALAACGGGGGDGGSPGANPNQPTLVTTAGTSLVLPVAVAREYQISGGVPPYRVSNSDHVIAEGEVSGNTLVIRTRAAGSAKVSVLDFSGALVEIAVQVGSSVPLYTTAPSDLTVGVGSSAARTFTIGGGGAPYTVQGGDSNVAIVEKVDAIHWKVTGVAIGATTVLIRDAAGEEISVALTVGAPELRMSPTDLVMPVGIKAIAKISGGQPPYRVAGGIPAAITATVMGDELHIQGSLASKLEISVMDAAGQIATVTVEINTATTSIRFSPSELAISENDSQPLLFSVFGATGETCFFTSDPSFLKPETTGCLRPSADGLIQIKLDTGTRGSRCVDGEKKISFTAVDSARATGIATVTIVDNGTCGAMAVLPATVRVNAGATSQLAITGGSGNYIVSSNNPSVATAVAAGNVIVVTAGDIAGNAIITIRDRSDSSKVVELPVEVVAASVATLSASPQTLSLQSGASADVLLSGGSGNFDFAISNSAVATATMTGNKLTVTAGTITGTATVTVRDKANNSTVAITVTVTTAATPVAPMTAAPAAATGAVQETLYFVLQNGTAPYTVVVSNPSIATATVNNNTVAAALRGAGNTTLVVTDGRGQTLNIAVTATQAQQASLRFAPSAFEVGEDSLAPITLTVFGGTPPYRALTSDLGLSNVEVNADTFTVGLGTRGNRCINPVDSQGKYLPREFFNVVLTVVDSGGAFATSTMTIRDNGRGDMNLVAGTCPQGLNLSTTAGAATSVLLGSSRTFSITGGVLPYTVSSSNTAVAPVALSSQAGLSITGLAAGTATVTVRDAAGSTSTIAVTVTP